MTHTILIHRDALQSRSRDDIHRHIEFLKEYFSDHLVTVRAIQRNSRHPIPDGWHTVVEVYEEVPEPEGEELDE